jgi:hypothetical protein
MLIHMSLDFFFTDGKQNQMYAYLRDLLSEALHEMYAF